MAALNLLAYTFSRSAANALVQQSHVGSGCFATAFSGRRLITFRGGRMGRLAEATSVLDQIDASAAEDGLPPNARGYGAVVTGRVPLPPPQSTNSAA